MLSVGKSSIVAVTVSVVMGILVGAAVANRLAASTQTLTTTWSQLTFTDAFGNAFICPVTLAGSLHSRTVTKTASALMGFINRASVGACGFGSATMLQAALPWHLRYRSFAGMLPNITSIKTDLIGVSFRLEATSGAACLFASGGTEPLVATFSRNTVSGAVTSTALNGTITSNEACSFGIRTSIRVDGSSTTVTALTITLI